MRNKKTSSVFLFRILLQHNSIFSQQIFNCLSCRAKTWTSLIGTFWVQTIVEITNTGTTFSFQ